MTSPRDEGQDQWSEAIRDEEIRDEENAARSGELWYANANDFMTDRLVHLVRRPAPGSGRVWCEEWYRHPEALSRVDSLWRAWEHLRFDPATGMSSWWLHHADPHLRALMDPETGPFGGCTDGHRNTEPLPVREPPEGLFFDQRMSTGDPLALD